MLVGLGFVPLFLSHRKTAHAKRTLHAMVLLVIAGGYLVGCGGGAGSNGGGTPPPLHTVAPGTYILHATADNGVLQRQLDLTLVVQ